MLRSAITLTRVALAASAIVLAQCHKEGSLEPDAQPVIELSASARSFTATAGGANPAQQSVLVTNSGTGTLSSLSANTTYEAGQPAGWLSLTLNPITAPATLELMPTTGSLLPGTYSATVTIGSPQADNGPRTVAVTFTVVASPTIVLSDIDHEFSAIAGGTNPAPVNIAVTNGGGGVLTGLERSITYQAGQPGGWLTATLSGTTAPATLLLAPATGTLAAGTYNATVGVTSAVAGNSPRSVSIRFTVTQALPEIGVSASSVTFNATVGGANPATRTLQVTNTGGGTLNGLGGHISYQAGQATGWLFAQLGTTNAPTTLTVRATVGVLTAGTYNATVTITAPGVSNSPKVLPVTLIVAPATGPEIGLSTNTRTFTATAGGANPPIMSLQVANTGSGTLTGLQATENPSASWLTLSLSSSTAPATLSFQATTGSLPAGSYTTTVNVTSPVASNSPQSVTVTFNVVAALSAPVLQTPSASGSNVALTWTFTWPGGLGSSNDGYQVEASTSPTSGFSQIYSVATHESPYTLTVTDLAPGTYYFRVRAVTMQGTTPYSTVRSAVVAGSGARITIVNRLDPGGSDKVMRFRVASTLAALTNANNTAAERLSQESYCGDLPGVSIDPGESMTFDVAGFAPNYFIHVGLGDWDNSDLGGGTGCWHKKMWGASPNFDLLYLFVSVQIGGHTGDVTYTLLTLANGNLVLRTPTGDIPVLVSVNQDPIR